MSTTATPESIVVTDSPQQSRYEIHADGELAAIEQYEIDGDVRVSFTPRSIRGTRDSDSPGRS